MKSYTHLTLLEREQIFAFKQQGKPHKEIARLVGRHRTTVSRELKRNNRPHKDMVAYVGVLAHQQAKQRKIQAGQRPRLKSAVIRAYVEEKITYGWSPEIIASQVPKIGEGKSVSAEAIYQYIYAAWPAGISFLARRHKQRYARGGKQSKRGVPPIPNKTPLAERAEAINARQELGHWEADSVVSMQSKPAINMLHERLTRVVRITLLADKSAAETEAAICRQLKAFPAAARRSITYDNGTENYQHEAINTALGTTSYFCQPYHSWEKGAVENSNGIFRRFFPKKTDFAQVTQAELDAVADWMNNRPRKCLGYKTPNEAFIELMGALPC